MTINELHVSDLEKTHTESCLKADQSPSPYHALKTKISIKEHPTSYGFSEKMSLTM